MWGIPKWLHVLTFSEGPSVTGYPDTSISHAISTLKVSAGRVGRGSLTTVLSLITVLFLISILLITFEARGSWGGGA